MKKKAMFYEALPEGLLHCFLCNHHCRIADLKYGFCGVRQNIGGKLYTMVYAKPVARCIDPIEKKPLYHFLPGTRAYSIATIGCNFRCGFCQNWQISQASMKDGRACEDYELKPEDIVREAKRQGCRSIAYTYTEPTIFFEYAYDTARLAKEEGIYNIFVTNGYMTKEALSLIRPFLDAANIDLKFFKDSSYNKVCHGRLQPVLDSISFMKESGIWVEVTTLIIPGLNDSEQELRDIAQFIADTGAEVPWHLSAFHPGYKYTDYEATGIGLLRKAEAIGREAGLLHVYLGNVAENTNTYCHSCNELLISRDCMYAVKRNLDNDKCPKCASPVAGRFDL